MAEAEITRKTKNYLDSMILAGDNLYYNKISDRYTSGIPDICGTINSISFYIELKDTGKEARKLQAWHLAKAKKAGAATLSTDSFTEVFNFMEKLRNFKVSEALTKLVSELYT